MYRFSPPWCLLTPPEEVRHLQCRHPQGHLRRNRSKSGTTLDWRVLRHHKSHHQSGRVIVPSSRYGHQLDFINSFSQEAQSFKFHWASMMSIFKKLLHQTKPRTIKQNRSKTALVTRPGLCNSGDVWPSSLICKILKRVMRGKLATDVTVRQGGGPSKLPLAGLTTDSIFFCFLF